MIRMALVGLGKMGLSHLAIIRPHPDVDLVGVCDSSALVLGALSKYTGLKTYTSYEEMLDTAAPEAVIIATPSHLHASMVRQALSRGIHVFCEKPLFLDPADGVELTELARQKGLVTQVGYHNRYVGAFREVKRLLDAGAIGTVTGALAEAYGPVVLKPAGTTWRSHRNTGGGCLYDYAAHPLDLITWYLGAPSAARGSRLVNIFSKEIDDEVTSTLEFGPQTTAQLSVNWSDESQRKMTTKVTLWGTLGRIYADRQEIQVYRRDTGPAIAGYGTGWTVKYTTELTPAPWFYVRGEEYSHQLDAFVRRVQNRELDGRNTFASASVTDRAIAMIIDDARAARSAASAGGGESGRAGEAALHGAGRDGYRSRPAEHSGSAARARAAVWVDKGRQVASKLAPEVARAARRVTARVTGKVKR